MSDKLEQRVAALEEAVRRLETKIAATSPKPRPPNISAGARNICVSITLTEPARRECRTGSMQSEIWMSGCSAK
jgi:hypothetical protein